LRAAISWNDPYGSGKGIWGKDDAQDYVDRSRLMINTVPWSVHSSRLLHRSRPLTLFTVHCSPFTAFNTVHSLRFTALNPVHCSRFTVHCRDLAALYGVETKVFKQAVRRNIDRFPEDFMFELTKSEFINWRSQFVTSNSAKMGLRYNPMAFTKLRHFVFDNVELRRELENLRADMDGKFQIVFETLDHLLMVESKPRKKIGFTVKEKQAGYRKQRNQQKKP
jgi:hypothetical protein